MTPPSSHEVGDGMPGGYKPISNGVDRITRAADFLKSYEKELSVALRWARTVALLRAISRFLALCNLTWASMVLLNAFSSSLLPLDLKFVACLLLLEAARLASASFFIGLPTRALAHLSQDPKHIIHGKAGRWPAAHYARIASQTSQLILIAPSLAISSARIDFTLSLGYDPKIHNLQSSLCIFYSFTVLNALTALISLVCSAVAFVSLNKPPEQSILRYYDKVLENAMNVGVVKADDFEFFSFAYTTLASEYSRNVQPEAVAKNYKKLIQYLYAHRLGVDFLQIYLDAEDAFVQLAAVNMIGYWADTTWGVGLKKVKLPEELLTKLADKVGTGQVGWAATSSFGVLARKPGGAHLVARTRTSSGCRLPDRLAKLVDATSARSLSLVRTLASIYEQLCVNEKGVARPLNETAESDLVEKLKQLARGAKVQRLRVQAAYLLLMMGEECHPSVILAIDPTQDSYWFQSEVSMLHLLRKRVDLLPLQLQRLAIRKDAPPLLSRSSLSSSCT